jgi:hypothetical protein
VPGRRLTSPTVEECGSTKVVEPFLGSDQYRTATEGNDPEPLLPELNSTTIMFYLGQAARPRGSKVPRVPAPSSHLQYVV